MMKPIFACAIALSGLTIASADAAPRAANTSARHAKALHFARGAYTLSERATIRGSQHRFYTLRVNAGQHLKISAQSETKSKSQLVPLIFVTPPCGKFNGDKTNAYAEDSSRAGIYRIEVTANQMASVENQGAFVLNIAAY